MMFSPLEQFSVLPVRIFKAYDNLHFISNFDLHYIVFFVVFLLFLVFTPYYFAVVPTLPQIIIEEIYFFVLGTVEQQVTFKGIKFFPLIFFNFIFILITNIFSLLPFSFTVTAQFLTVFILAFSFNILFFFLGLRLNGFSFFYLFYRADLSLGLRLLLVPIEIFSYSLRTISLSVRLFANMMAGHSLMHIITSFVIILLSPVPTVFDFFLITLLLAIFTLELGVAFLQAFIFTILLSIYLNDAFNPRH
jgi:ATP synthase subunit 6